MSQDSFYQAFILSLLPAKTPVEQYPTFTIAKLKKQLTLFTTTFDFDPELNRSADQLFQFINYKYQQKQKNKKKTRSNKQKSQKEQLIIDFKKNQNIVLSKLQYEILLEGYLSLIGYETRSVWALDISHLRKKGFITIHTANKQKKKNNNTKKSDKRGSLRVLDISSGNQNEEEEEEEEQEEEEKRQQSKQKQSTQNLDAMLSQLSYQQSPKPKGRVTRLQSKKRVENSQNQSQSSINSLDRATVSYHNKKKKAQVKLPQKNTKAIKKVKPKKTQSNQNQTNQVHYLQIFDSMQSQWVTIDFTMLKIQQQGKNSKLLHSLTSSQFTYLITVGAFDAQNQFYDRLNRHFPSKNPKLLYSQDITLFHVKNVKQTIKQRNTFILHNFIEQQLQSLFSYTSIKFCQNPVLKTHLLDQKMQAEQIQMSVMPKTQKQFKFSRFFTLYSSLKKYQGLKPDAKIVQGFQWNNQPVYLKKDIVLLHSAERWKRIGRKVRANQVNVKRIKATFVPDKIIELYGAWQTQPYKVQIIDGKIPVVI